MLLGLLLCFYFSVFSLLPIFFPEKNNNEMKTDIYIWCIDTQLLLIYFYDPAVAHFAVHTMKKSDHSDTIIVSMCL